MLQNARVISFCRFRVIKERPTEGRVKFPTQIRVKVMKSKGQLLQNTKCENNNVQSPDVKKKVN